MTEMIATFGRGFVVALLLLGAVPAAAQDDPLATRVAAARDAYQAAIAELDTGMGNAESVYCWSKRWLQAQREKDPSADRAALEAHQTRMQELAGKVTPLVQTGMLKASAARACDYYAAEAAVWLAGKSGD